MTCGCTKNNSNKTAVVKKVNKNNVAKRTEAVRRVIKKSAYIHS